LRPHRKEDERESVLLQDLCGGLVLEEREVAVRQLRDGVRVQRLLLGLVGVVEAAAEVGGAPGGSLGGTRRRHPGQDGEEQGSHRGHIVRLSAESREKNQLRNDKISMNILLKVKV
jgi:hypothetical protein